MGIVTVVDVVERLVDVDEDMIQTEQSIVLAD